MIYYDFEYTQEIADAIVDVMKARKEPLNVGDYAAFRDNLRQESSRIFYAKLNPTQIKDELVAWIYRYADSVTYQTNLSNR